MIGVSPKKRRGRCGHLPCKDGGQSGEVLPQDKEQELEEVSQKPALSQWRECGLAPTFISDLWPLQLE